MQLPNNIIWYNYYVCLRHYIYILHKSMKKAQNTAKVVSLSHIRASITEIKNRREEDNN